jgi:hypothetical protein
MEAILLFSMLDNEALGGYAAIVECESDSSSITATDPPTESASISSCSAQSMEQDSNWS